MSLTLADLVKKQILDEGPQLADWIQRDWYVEVQLNLMNNSQLLELISDCLTRVTASSPERGWR